MKVLLVLAAVGVLGGNAHPPSIGVSDVFEDIWDYGGRMASYVVAMMDNSFDEYIADQGDLIISRQLSVKHVDENMIQQCRIEYRERNAYIYEGLKRNLLGCARATADKVDNLVQVGRLIAPLQDCQGVSTDPFDTIPCLIKAALPAPYWRSKLPDSVEFIRRSANELMTNMSATASEGVECAVSKVVKARKVSAAVARKFEYCIEEVAEGNYEGQPFIIGTESWSRDPVTDDPEAYDSITYSRVYGSRADYPGAYGPGAGGPGTDAPVTDDPEAYDSRTYYSRVYGSRADYPGAYGPGAGGPRAVGPKTDLAKAYDARKLYYLLHGPKGNLFGVYGPGTDDPITDLPNVTYLPFDSRTENPKAGGP